MKYNNIIVNENNIKLYLKKYNYVFFLNIEDKNEFIKNLLKKGPFYYIDLLDFKLIKITKTFYKKFLPLNLWTNNLYMLFVNELNNNVFYYLKEKNFLYVLASYRFSTFKLFTNNLKKYKPINIILNYNIKILLNIIKKPLTILNIGVNNIINNFIYNICFLIKHIKN